jgi:light-regulated signal transduction histidine kinase (bacteriophytochrome)
MEHQPSSTPTQRLAFIVLGAGIIVTLVVVLLMAGSDTTDFRRALLLVTVLAGIAITALSVALIVMLGREQKRSALVSEQMTDRLADREHALMQSNRELERFATIAAHDLQEPLRTILTFTDLTERRFGPTLEPEARDYILRVAGAAARMRNLIEDLLLYARIGQAERQFERVDLNQVAREAVANVEPLIIETGAHIEIGELPVVMGNEQGLLQLLTNLLSNAIKYKLADAPFVRIEAQQRQAEREWIIAVSDNGKGIDPANHDRIFELFRRLEPRGVSGTGLGLAICARIVDVHGGRIWVRSSLGKGATFYFTLPIRSAAGRRGRSRS